MKICFLAPAGNYHTRKWCNYFVGQGHEVHVVSFINEEMPGVILHWVDSGATVNESDRKKLSYLLQAGKVGKIVKEINPDIINAHYATSYGTVAALAGLKNYVLSVWGADIYDFPQKSFMHKLMLKFSLARATYIFSTSEAMAEETNKYTNKKIEITPFGVDMELFSPNRRERDVEDTDFIVGTVKSIAPKYGIDYLLKAVRIVKHEHPEIPIRLRIAGKGAYENEYKQLAEELDIAEITTWLGFISQEQAAKEWASMDLAVVYSTLLSESFGVSAVEAQACETPVIISDIPGLMEATKPGETSYVVIRKDERKLADAIISLYQDEYRRKQYGKLGRIFVTEQYDIRKCFESIEQRLEEYCHSVK